MISTDNQPLTNQTTDFDVLIVGAGVSGIGAGCHLSRNCPNKHYKILERRQDIGGTWDLFRYPGIRSDSDMATFGFNFKPWKEDNMLANGQQIKDYLIETAQEYKVTQHIQFGCKVQHQHWCSQTKLWTVHYQDEQTGRQEQVSARFLLACTGYYNYDHAYTPNFKGKDDFLGDIIHPQFWPENYDYSDKKVIVIGSGATAVTIVPNMAKTASHVTMLQRSPTYIASLPNKDPIAEKLRGKLSDLSVYRFARVRNVISQIAIFKLAKARPDLVSNFLYKDTQKTLGKDYDMTHFTPDYEPWDQRLCVAPDGDLFEAIKSGKVEMVTDSIDHFTKTGIQLASGTHVEADIIVTATGLALQLGGGTETFIDGEKVDFSQKMTYKGVMVENVPNFAILFGYINNAWTLKIDIALEYLCNLLNYMDKKGYKQVMPNDTDHNKTSGNLFESMHSGYIQRSESVIPRQGKKLPWKVTNSFLLDAYVLKLGKIKDKSLLFKK